MLPSEAKALYEKSVNKVATPKIMDEVYAEMKTLITSYHHTQYDFHHLLARVSREAPSYADSIREQLKAKGYRFSEHKGDPTEPMDYDSEIIHFF